MFFCAQWRSPVWQESASAKSVQTEEFHLPLKALSGEQSGRITLEEKQAGRLNWVREIAGVCSYAGI